MDEKPLKKRFFGKFLKFCFLFIFAWFVWTGVTAFRYKPIVNPATGLLKYYLKGGYHMHSTFSDGRGDISHLAREAKAAGLNWIIVTDHGGPNREAQSSLGWYDGILVIGASELSCDAGHLAVIGATSEYRLPYESQLAIDDLNYHQGLTFIAHPFDDKIPWTDWTVSRFSGIEIFSAYESVKRAPWYRYLQFPVQYFVNPHFAILRLLSFPTKTVETWDRLNSSRNPVYSGIFALDVHGKLPLTAKIALPFPSYGSMFSSLMIYVKKPETDFVNLDASAASGLICQAIKTGAFFNVIESMAPADGLVMTVKPDKEGTEASTQKWSFMVKHPLNETVNLRLMADGKIVHTKEALPQEYAVDLTKPGRYRAELYLPNHPFATLPWVMTNPFDIPFAQDTQNQSRPSSVALTPPFFWTIPKDIYTIESNPESLAEIIMDEGQNTLSAVTTMRYMMRRPTLGSDAWCSLAIRDAQAITKDLAQGAGVFVEISANRRTCLWLEVRTSDAASGAEQWYRHSMMVDLEKSAHLIPFASMRQINGDRQTLKPSAISAVFVSINNSTAFFPAEGEIRLFQLGGYLKKHNNGITPD